MTGTELPNIDTWKIEVTSPALKGFGRLPEKAAAALVEFDTGPLADNPHRPSKPLTNKLLGLLTAGRVDYRVLFILDVETTSCTSTTLNTDPTYTSRASRTLKERCAFGASPHLRLRNVRDRPSKHGRIRHLSGDSHRCCISEHFS